MPRKKREQNNPPAPQRLSEEDLAFMAWLAPAFPAWYRANYDEDGNRIGAALPGLRNLAAEARQQIEAGEAEEGGFAIEEDQDA